MGVALRAGLWLTCLWLLVACAGAPIYGDGQVLEGTVELVCSETCLSRGACRPTGPLMQRTVYLGTEPAFPSASGVGFAGLPAGTSVTILETELVDGIEQGTGRSLEIRFYRVDDMATGMAGWVPGFCLMRRS